MEKFSPFVLYIDGMLGKEALVVLMNLSWTMAAKMEEPILHVQGWGNNNIPIVVTGLYSNAIFRYCHPSPLQYRDLYGKLVSGLELAQ